MKIIVHYDLSNNADRDVLTKKQISTILKTLGFVSAKPLVEIITIQCSNNKFQVESLKVLCKDQNIRNLIKTLEVRHLCTASTQTALIKFSCLQQL